jgi:hypothetical protein
MGGDAFVESNEFDLHMFTVESNQNHMIVPNNEACLGFGRLLIPYGRPLKRITDKNYE